MKNLDRVVKEKLNVNRCFRSMIEINQSIANVTANNTHGQYDALISELMAEKAEAEAYYKSIEKSMQVLDYKYTDAEVSAINHFNSDNKFTITE